VLKQVGMSEKKMRMPHELSGGEQQRIAIARALLNNPKLIVADEPTGNLDPETAEGVVKMLKEISQHGTSVIMSTHNLSLVEQFPGIVYKCEQGKIEDITKSYRDVKLIDEPDRDNIEVKYTERMEI
jgi:cell division transport system ATP-binding protein